jgi:hypothetical protein
MVWFRVYIDLNIALYCSDDIRTKTQTRCDFQVASYRLGRSSLWHWLSAFTGLIHQITHGRNIAVAKDVSISVTKYALQHHLDILALRARGIHLESLFTPLPPLDWVQFYNPRTFCGTTGRPWPRHLQYLFLEHFESVWNSRWPDKIWALCEYKPICSSVDKVHDTEQMGEWNRCNHGSDIH